MFEIDKCLEFCEMRLRTKVIFPDAKYLFQSDDQPLFPFKGHFFLYSVFLPFALTLFCGNSDNHYNLTEGKSCHHPRRKSPFFTNVKKRRFIVISHMRQKVNTEMNCVALKKLSAAQMLRRLVLDELFNINFLLCQILNPIIFTTQTSCDVKSRCLSLVF